MDRHRWHAYAANLVTGQALSGDAVLVMDEPSAGSYEPD
jgi:hypothetical protein